MRIVKAGHDNATAEFNPFGLRPRQRRDLLSGPDGDNAFALDGERFRCRVGWVGRENLAVEEYQVRGRSENAEVRDQREEGNDLFDAGR
jgi:hypothetical protein